MDLFNQLFAVGAVLLLFGGGLFVLRQRGLVRFNSRMPGLATRQRHLQSIERLALTPQHSIHLIRVRGCELIIAVSPSGCSVLDKSGAAETQL